MFKNDLRAEEPRSSGYYFFLWRFFLKRFLRLWVAILCFFRFLPLGIVPGYFNVPLARNLFLVYLLQIAVHRGLHGRVAVLRLYSFKLLLCAGLFATF